MENCEKSAEMFSKKAKNALILLKSQLSAQEGWKCKTVLQIRKSTKKCPAQSEQAYPLQNCVLENGERNSLNRYVFFASHKILRTLITLKLLGIEILTFPTHLL